MRGMKLRSSGMGSSCHWTESLLFDNCCQDFPVEMFVELMAEECKDRHSDEEICRRAMQHLPPGTQNYSIGIQSIKMLNEYKL